MIEDTDFCLRTVDGSDKVCAEQSSEKRQFIIVFIHLFSNLPRKVREYILIIEEDAEDVLATIHGRQATDIDILVLLDCCFLLQVVQVLQVILRVHLEWTRKF